MTEKIISKSGFTLAEGATGVNKECRLGLLPHKFPFLARKGQGGSVPVRGKHITIETIPSLFVRGASVGELARLTLAGEGLRKQHLLWQRSLSPLQSSV